MIDRSKMTSSEVGERGKALYEQKVRRLVETEQNIGKVVVIHVETDEFAVDETGLESSRKLHKKHPGAALYAIRIGYNAYAAVGGSLKRTAP